MRWSMVVTSCRSTFSRLVGAGAAGGSALTQTTPQPTTTSVIHHWTGLVRDVMAWPYEKACRLDF